MAGDVHAGPLLWCSVFAQNVVVVLQLLESLSFVGFSGLCWLHSIVLFARKDSPSEGEAHNPGREHEEIIHSITSIVNSE